MGRRDLARVMGVALVTALSLLAVACIPIVNKDTIPTGSSGFSTVRLTPTSEPVGGSDGTGAFRTVCDFSHMNFDDPIVYPGQPGKAHLHAYFGNTGANASSTASSIRTSGNSTCRGGIVNRTAYWVPAMIDTSTNDAIAPDELVVYYKSGYGGVRPADVRAMPTGLRMIAGDMASTAPQSQVHWECEDVGYASRTDHIPSCPAGDRVLMMLDFPQCWDGVNLDSANHKSHMAYPTGRGCPASHPVAIPVITYNMYVEVGPGQDTADWRLSSDTIDDPELPGGYSAHGDWFDGWDAGVRDAWIRNCVQAAADCHGHLVGDGRAMF
jgi:hypothetical protein